MEKGEGKAVPVSCFFPSPKKAIRLFGAKIKVESVKFIFGITHLLSLFCNSKYRTRRKKAWETELARKDPRFFSSCINLIIIIY